MARLVELENGGKKVALNEFARQITENVIIGIAEVLKGVNIDDEIIITLGKKEK